MATDLAKLETLQYQLVDARAALKRRGLRTHVVDDALAKVRGAITSAIAKTSVLRKSGADAIGWRGPDSDRDEHRRRLAKRSGGALAQALAAEDGALWAIRKAQSIPSRPEALGAQ